MTVAKEGVVDRHRREGVQGSTLEVQGCRLEEQGSTVEEGSTVDEGSTPTDNLWQACLYILGLPGGPRVS